MNQKFNRYILRCLIIIAVVVIISPITYWLLHNKDAKHQEEAKRIVSICQDKSLTESCYPKQFSLLATNNQLSYVNEVLMETKVLDRKVLFCHSIAHSISTAFIRKNPEKWLELFRIFGVDDCSAGFLHGMIESKAGNDPSYKLTAETSNDICNAIVNISKNQKDYVLKNCLHGIGHAFLLEAFGEIEVAVKECEALGFKNKEDCYLGVFMESHQRSNLIIHGLADYLPGTDAELSKQKKICSTFKNQQSAACWLSLAWFINKVYNFDENKLFENCQESPVKKARFNCYSWGINMTTVFSLSQNIPGKEISKLCDPYLYNTDLYTKCVNNQVGYTINASKSFVKDVNRMCDKVNDLARSSCKQELNRIYSSKNIQNSDKPLTENIFIPN